MTQAVPANGDRWLAFYVGRDGRMRVARDARGLPIECETEQLALSVARYRRKRMRIWK
jgi:hypothetical protein